MTPAAAAILEGMPDPRLLHRADRHGTPWILAGSVVLACYPSGDAGMRNVAVAVCRQLGFGGQAVAGMMGLTENLCRAKIGTWSLSWLFVLSGCSAILADPASDCVLAFDPGSEIDGLAGFSQWRSLLPRLMGPVRVVMSRVLGQDAPEMLLAVDQHVIETLAAQRSHIPFRERICPR